jgi:hypothetical protein
VSDERKDAAFLRRKDDEHVSMFKSCDYASIMEFQEIAAVQRYIAELESERDALKHDLERHIAIASEEATRAAEVEASADGRKA